MLRFFDEICASETVRSGNAPLEQLGSARVFGSSLHDLMPAREPPIRAQRFRACVLISHPYLIYHDRVTQINRTPPEDEPLSESLHDKHTIEHNLIAEAQHPQHGAYKYVRGPLTRSVDHVVHAAPLLGEQTMDVLAEIGYARDRLNELQEHEVFVSSPRENSRREDA